VPSVTYIESNGASHTIDVPVGDSVMRGAFSHGIEGIVAECGGALACATCHCYVDEAWTARVGPASEAEAQMLDFAASPKQPNSRLSCQITMADALDGLVVRLPASQI
jgi:ferredoxin, 2Fe-2S